MRKPTIGVLGATGVVGRNILKILEENKNCTFGELWWRYHLPSFAWLGFEEGDYKNLLKKIKLS